jgi:hypothetical protein
MLYDLLSKSGYTDEEILEEMGNTSVSSNFTFPAKIKTDAYVKS